jgi:hypothetical protein
MYTGTYVVPVAGDKVFRSPKHGQKELRAKFSGVRHMKVDDRDNAFTKNGIELVKVSITANSKNVADSCYQEGVKMVHVLLAKLATTKPATTSPMTSPPTSPTTTKPATTSPMTSPTTTKPATTSPMTSPMTITYFVPEEADKVVRSPKHGQAKLKENHPTCRIRVDDRSNAQTNAKGIRLVKVWITAPTKEKADACFNEARQMIIEKSKSSTTSTTSKTKKLTQDELFVGLNASAREIIRLREANGEYDHLDQPNIQWLIDWREEKGIKSHTDLGMTDYEDPRPIMEFDYSMESWGDYHEKMHECEQANPEYKVIG